MAPAAAGLLRSVTRTLPLAGLAALAACEYPTKVPQIEQTWVVPTDSTALLVDELLPTELRVVANAFRFTPPPTSVSRTLGAMCGLCVTSGTPVPKPAFTATISGSVGTGSDILSSQLTAGNTFRVTLTHNFNFDPIRPSVLGARGFIVTELRSGGALVGRDSVNGTQTGWSATTPLVRDIPLTAGVVVASGTPIVVDVTINSPTGDPVAITTSQQATVSATPTNLGVSNVRIRVSSKAVAATTINLDVEDISDDFSQNVVAGAMLFTITNPFVVSGSMTLNITVPGQAPINKVLTLSNAATSSAEIAFTGAELESILGKSGVVMSLSGTVSGPAAGVLVTPGQVLGLANKLRLTIRVGG